MSEQQQGPGWWLASDGKWYPPDQAPPMPPAETWATPPAGPPPRSRMSGGAVAGLVIVGVLGFVLLIGGAILLARDSGEDASGTSRTTGAEPDDGEPDATEPDPSDLPEDFAYIEGDGVAIAAPDSWAAVNPDDFGLTAEGFAQLFPDLEQEMIDQMVTGLAQGAILVAYDMVGGQSNVNIQRVPGEAPFEVLEVEVPRQLAALGAEGVDSAIVDTAAGEVFRIEYSLDVALPGQVTSTTTYGVQFYVPIDGQTYVVTISGDEDIRDVGDQMIDTLRTS